MKAKKLYILPVMLAVLMLVTIYAGYGVRAASAEPATDSEVYTDVIEDLTSAGFDFESCPALSNDYSLQVIQIAESDYGELFVYVYQPAAEVKPLVATSINISTAINESLSYVNYKLRLVSVSGVLSKYVVEGFEVKTDVIRYYDISGIYRKWDEELDAGLPEYNENDITEAVFEVAQRWTACTVNGEVSYQMTFQDTVYITDKYIGYIRYTSDYVPEWLNVVTAGTLLRQTHYDSHYIAFSCEYQIDKLLEADVYYVSQAYEIAAMVPIYGKKIEREVKLTYSDTKTVETSDGSGWTITKNSYTWNRIESVSDFMTNEELSDEAREDLSGKQWVLRFTETTTDIVPIALTMKSTRITDVSIFRLKFEMDGKTYNLGVVDNKQSPAVGQLPDNPKPEKAGFDFLSWLAGLFGIDLTKAQIIFWVVVGVIVAAILITLISVISRRGSTLTIRQERPAQPKRTRTKKK